ncbi:Tigger transposable element derived 5 [Thelohanellus kitauei]|uniref:Tigger transposable element derived 5 n=1 Tax=Thelohanellus kitauei TaxID=669202 RepID=A0A0C2M2B1_THEKT|nr:Tigger transposable element derived 5 [Thelohanellus kitauei]
MLKRKSYSVKDKLEINDRIKNGESKAKISRETCIAESTLRGWMKQEEILRGCVGSVVEGEALKKMKVRPAKDDELNNAVFTWIVQEQRAGTSLSGPIIRTQDEKFNQRLHPDKAGPSEPAEQQNFVASKGCLHRFQKRHGIGAVTISGEQRSADTQAADDFPEVLKEQME